jgi:formylglycine-generating enzyme required for sulfatase activity
MALIAAIKCDATDQTWTDTPGSNETRPMNCVTWYEAMAFCAWDGGYLPTEAEWNYAAAGGDQQRAYPWSSPAASVTIDGSYASYGCLGDGIQGCLLNDLLPVGTKPAGDGRWGQSDLGGNVSEWTLDRNAPYATPCTDCANLAPSQERMVRGGDFEYGPDRLRTSFRDYITPSLRHPVMGIRCARAP